MHLGCNQQDSEQPSLPTRGYKSLEAEEGTGPNLPQPGGELYLLSYYTPGEAPACFSERKAAQLQSTFSIPFGGRHLTATENHKGASFNIHSHPCFVQTTFGSSALSTLGLMDPFCHTEPLQCAAQRIKAPQSDDMDFSTKEKFPSLALTAPR